MAADMPAAAAAARDPKVVIDGGLGIMVRRMHLAIIVLEPRCFPAPAIGATSRSLLDNLQR